MNKSDFIKNVQKYVDWAMDRIDQYPHEDQMDSALQNQFPELGVDYEDWLNKSEVEHVVDEAFECYQDGCNEARAENDNWGQLNDISQEQLAGEQFQDRYDMYRNEY